MNNDETQRHSSWMVRLLHGLLCGVLLCAGFATSSAFMSPRPAAAQIPPLTPVAGVLSPGLQRSLETAQPTDRLRIIVRFKLQADLARASQAAGASSSSARAP